MILCPTPCRAFPKWSLPGEQFSSKTMLLRIQQELLKTSYVIFRLFHDDPLPNLSPVEHGVGLAKRQMPSCYSVRLAAQDLWPICLTGQHKVSNQLNAGPCGGM
ncbi:hypothetical protein TNCV_4966611 [Trichonephila clavipes]|nr:hypothetical protein TNCV_4966611 [Trichonephila clavipes]